MTSRRFAAVSFTLGTAANGGLFFIFNQWLNPNWIPVISQPNNGGGRIQKSFISQTKYGNISSKKKLTSRREIQDDQSKFSGHYCSI
ncbi:hypothetical protein REC12_17660 [Desulfosporosinus sp. PR]|uniref:hypothetical protein n=1 Tax=Candidatus Desulfosporosinus nitrosoreducens TaxID=3401928 RepID=UPI0027E9BF24|nr:hypothetical protein [Desulfosporosinus sp. PR]MDQ7095420.1 hypothetical protein [Desulfosporosinus sp. PR]